MKSSLVLSLLSLLAVAHGQSEANVDALYESSSSSSSTTPSSSYTVAIVEDALDDVFAQFHEAVVESAADCSVQRFLRFHGPSTSSISSSDGLDSTPTRTSYDSLSGQQLTKIRDIVVEKIVQEYEEFVIPLEAARLQFCDTFRRRMQFAFDRSPLSIFLADKYTAADLTLLGFTNSRFGLASARTSEPTDETSRSAASTDREVSTSFIASPCLKGAILLEEDAFCCVLRLCSQSALTFDDFTDCVATTSICEVPT